MTFPAPPIRLPSFLPVVPMLVLLSFACGGAEERAKGGGSGTPTFSGEIAAFVERHCIDCHHRGGGGPFPLVTYDEVSKRARQCLVVLRSGYMPPWKPVAGHGDFLGARFVEDSEIERFARWVEAGAPLGDAGDLVPPEPPSEGWMLGPPDAVLSMTEAFELPAEGGDVWSGFSIPTNFGEERWLRAVEFRHRDPRTVHHLLMYVDSKGQDGEPSRDSDGAEAARKVGMMSAADRLAQRLVAAWGPGATPVRLPPEHAFRLPPGADLRLSMHFQTTGRPETILSEVGLHFAEGPPARPMSVVDLAVDTINILPGEPAYRIRESVVLPVDVEVVSLAPHAHRVCREVRVLAHFADGSSEVLLWIDDWDFNWQTMYRLREPLALSAGTRIEIEFTYDNSAANPRNPNSPPRRIVSGSRSLDEMGHVWLQVVVGSEDERDRLESLRAEEIAAKLAGPRHSRTSWMILRAFDHDGDGSLDPAEDAAAVAFVLALRDDPESQRKLLDLDGDGELDPGEQAELERLISLWMGQRPAQESVGAQAASVSER